MCQKKLDFQLYKCMTKRSAEGKGKHVVQFYKIPFIFYNALFVILRGGTGERERERERKGKGGTAPPLSQIPGSAPVDVAVYTALV